LCALSAFAICSFKVEDIQVVQVPVVTGARIQFFRLPWPSTRFVATKVIQDNHGFLWLSASLATDDGITALDPVTSKTTCYQPRRNADPTIAEKRVVATLPSRDGTLWITSTAGIYIFDRRSGKVTRHFQLETSSGRKFRPTGFPATPFQDSTLPRAKKGSVDIDLLGRSLTIADAGG